MAPWANSWQYGMAYSNIMSEAKKHGERNEQSSESENGGERHQHQRNNGVAASINISVTSAAWRIGVA